MCLKEDFKLPSSSCAVAYLGPHGVCLCGDFYWLNGGPPQRPPKDPVSRAGLAVHRAVVFNNYWLCKYLWASRGEDGDDYCLNYSAQFPRWWVDFLLLFSSSKSNPLFSTFPRFICYVRLWYEWKLWNRLRINASNLLKKKTISHNLVVIPNNTD